MIGDPSPEPLTAAPSPEPLTAGPPPERGHGEARQLTRRGLLGVTAAAGAGALLGPAVGAAAVLGFPDSGIRRVFERRVGTLRGESAPLRAPRRFALAGVSWTGWAGSGSARIELRTRRQDGRWSPWALASVQGHEPDRPAASRTRFGEPVWIGAADLIQLRSLTAVEGVRLHFVASEPSGGLASAATFGLVAPALDAGPGQPQIIARSAWAGRHAPPAGPASYGAIDLAFVHHTENPNGYTPSDVPAMLLAIFDYHRYVRGYFDIAYNFIIDDFGRTWEARAGGIDEPVIGAHAGGFNAVSTGVAVLGTFISSAPSARALGALERLLAWKLSLHGVPPLGRVGVRVDPGAAFYTRFRPDQLVQLHRVSGHRDGDQTDCPGDAFYRRLPSLRPRIAKLAGTAARLTLEPAAGAVTPATRVALHGRLALLSGAPVARAPVQLQRLADGRASTIATVTTAADGSWTYTLPVTRAITLRALHAAAPAAASNVATIAIRPVLTLALQSVSPPRVSGSITPPKPRVTINTYRLVGGHRELLDRRSVRARQGQFSAGVALGKTGPPTRRPARLVVIAATAADGGTLAGQSPPVTVTL